MLTFYLYSTTSLIKIFILKIFLFVKYWMARKSLEKYSEFFSDLLREMD